MNCAECSRAVAGNDYLCSVCRNKLEPLTQTPKNVLDLIGWIVELNREESYINSWEDEYAKHPYVMIHRPLRSQWTHVNLVIQEDTQFSTIKQLRVLKEFVIWDASPDIYEVKHGEVEDDPIPTEEYRDRLRYYEEV